MVGGLRILPEELRSFDSVEFDGTFLPIGSPLEHPSCLVKFINNSNVLVTISWNGVTSHDIMPSNFFTLYDINTNAGTERGLYIGQGTQFYVSGAAGGGNAGLVYLTSFYIAE